MIKSRIDVVKNFDSVSFGVDVYPTIDNVLNLLDLVLIKKVNIHIDKVIFGLKRKSLDLVFTDYAELEKFANENFTLKIEEIGREKDELTLIERI